MRALLRAHLRRFVGEHDRRIADLDFGMPDLAARSGHAQELDGAERFFVELERARGVVEDEVRGDGVITRGNGFDGHDAVSFDVGWMNRRRRWRRDAKRKWFRNACRGMSSNVDAGTGSRLPLLFRPVLREHRGHLRMRFDAQQRFVKHRTRLLQMRPRSRPFRHDGGEKIERAEPLPPRYGRAGKRSENISQY